MKRIKSKDIIKMDLEMDLKGLKSVLEQGKRLNNLTSFQKNIIISLIKKIKRELKILKKNKSTKLNKGPHLKK